MVFHDSEVPEGGTQWVGRGSQGVHGSLLCLLRHSWIQRPRIAAALDECSGRPLLTVWTCGQRLRFPHNDVPAQRTEVRGVCGGQVSEVHEGRSFIPHEDTTTSSFPGKRSWTHHGVNDSTPLLHARDVTDNKLKLAPLTLGVQSPITT